MAFLSTPSARRATTACVAMSWTLLPFLSTPSARRATRSSPSTSMTRINFYPRPPRGGRRDRGEVQLCSADISIHALREEGDPWPRFKHKNHSISIHALREEGDTAFISPLAAAMYFYPRPPRGGRLAQTGQRAAKIRISIHALREEGDKRHTACIGAFDVFLSTPSARRAT